jgi:ADP-ribose pyrophosphatase YjhB (NUDIX family)
MPRLDDPAARQPLRGFSRGAPEWMAPILRNCSRCGAELTYGPVSGEERDRYHCTTCGHVTYVNPRVVATTLPITDEGEIVLIRRAIPPGVGTWAQPGGFLEAEETVIQGAVRETLEETGLEVEPVGIVGVYPQPRAAVVIVVYEAAIVSGEMVVTPETLEVRAFALEDLPWDGIGFNTSLWAVRDYVRRVRPDFDVERLGSEQNDF